MASSASAQIEATAGDKLRTTVNGVDRPDYGKVQGILIGVTIGYIIILCLIVS
jgi:SHS family lactate transporter-like MFS transporter